MADYKINAEVLQSILNYLVTRPYSEVVSHVTAIQQAQPIEQKAADLSPENQKHIKGTK